MNTESRRQFPAFEATSLNNKLKQLWLAGIEAKLVFETQGGNAWGTLHVCLGEHPGRHPLPHHPQEPPQRHFSPAKQRRRERREAARVAEAAAVKASAEKEEVAEQVMEPENANETLDSNTNSNKVTAEVSNSKSDQAAVIEETVQVSATAGQVIITDVDDEICSDEKYYDEIDPGEAFSCLECNIEHFPENYEEGGKVKRYGLCRWHLGVSKCKNCSRTLIGLGTIRVHRTICRAPS